MADLIYFGIGVLFFVVAAAYVAVCRRLSEVSVMSARIDRRSRDLGAAARVPRVRDAAPGEVLT